ncbi:MAG: MMPL family transporter [Labilithrix sp.]|nr:MMPL family transporter [Labilithrix sp.]
MQRLSSPFRRFVDAMVDLGGRRPWLVIAWATAMLVVCWSYARKLEVRSDIMELLPRDSPGFQSFERRLERVGGRATLTIVCESPDRAANERFIDAFDQRVRATVDERAACAQRCAPGTDGEACRVDCGPDLIASIESGTKDIHTFFEANKWLYAKGEDLEEVDRTLDRQIAIKSGLVEDLLDEDTGAERALGMDKFKERFEKSAGEKDDFPTGYFASKDGTQIALRIMSTTSGLGGANDEQLLQLVERITNELQPASFHPEMKVGFGGDIPNANAEKEALVKEALFATLIAAALILVGVIWFYGSPWSLLLVGFPPLFGVGCAYAFATWNYGYVNASGMFLGAIILGNGVNYPIVLYSRYKEFRARGMSPDLARREAVWNAFRAELVGSSVASIAYGSLTITHFRGFSQFGVIGFFGMLLVWISMIPCLPALIVLVERWQKRFPAWLQERPGKLDEEGSRGPVARFVGNVTERWPYWFVGAAAVITLALSVRLPSFLKDPWEYDFDKLGSKGARTSGAFQWSKKADAILSGRMNLAGSLVLADHPDQVPGVKERILANDAADPEGAMIDTITTLSDFLPGAPAEQEAKLEVLERIRDRLTPKVMSSLSEDERRTVEEMVPPESLGVVGPEDLPGLLKTRFSERDGTLGTVLYVRYKPEIARNDGHNLLRMAQTIDGVRLPDGTRVDTASRATVFAEMIRSLERDGPLATAASFLAVLVVVTLATSSKRGTFAVILSLVLGVVWMLGTATLFGGRLNFLNFIALPITFGIGSEYPFNIFDRSRLLGGDVTGAVKLHFGAVALCSYTTVVGYGSLLFADNQALGSFGRFAIGGEIACFLAAVLFLPSLLHLIGAHKVGKGARPDDTHGSAPPAAAPAPMASKP